MTIRLSPQPSRAALLLHQLLLGDGHNHPLSVLYHLDE